MPYKDSDDLKLHLL